MCGGTVLEANVEAERAASPGTAKHQVAPWTGGLLLVLKHKLGHVALLYSFSSHNLSNMGTYGEVVVYFPGQ